MKPYNIHNQKDIAGCLIQKYCEKWAVGKADKLTTAPITDAKLVFLIHKPTFFCFSALKSR
jgi:hypothetical protein